MSKITEVRKVTIVVVAKDIKEDPKGQGATDLLNFLDTINFEKEEQKLPIHAYLFYCILGPNAREKLYLLESTYPSLFVRIDEELPESQNIAWKDQDPKGFDGLSENVIFKESKENPHEEKFPEMEFPDELFEEGEEEYQNPDHYKSHPSGVECIQITEHMNYNLGNAYKYIWRNGLKKSESVEKDLNKAMWYLHREMLRQGLNCNWEAKK